MKIRLLNDGGYVGLYDVKFPAYIDAMAIESRNYLGRARLVAQVSSSELSRIGCDEPVFSALDYYSFACDSFEVIND